MENKDAHFVSHELDQRNFNHVVANIRQRLINMGNTINGPLSEKLDILKQLTEFEFGRHILQNNGVNGRWTHYMSYEYYQTPSSSKHPLESRLFSFGLWASIKERLDFVQSCLQPDLRDGIALLSVPCGVMADLLTLDYAGLSNFQLVGIDLDPDSLALAKNLARERNLSDNTSFFLEDAWNISLTRKFDKVVCLGLIPYVRDERKVLLFKALNAALIDEGELFVNFRTPPAHIDPHSEQNRTSVSAENLQLNKVMSSEILQMKNSSYCSSASIKSMLEASGFLNIRIHFDRECIQGVAVAEKGRSASH